MPNQGCWGCGLMCVGPAAKLRQQQRELQQEGHLCSAVNFLFCAAVTEMDKAMQKISHLQKEKEEEPQLRKGICKNRL